MRAQGYKIHCGQWLVDGNPQIVLFDIGSGAWRLDEFKQHLWDTCNLGIPHLDIEANDAVIFGYMVAQFVEEFRKAAERMTDSPPRIVAHFHEWQTGVGLIALRWFKIYISSLLIRFDWSLWISDRSMWTLPQYSRLTLLYWVDIYAPETLISTITWIKL